MEEKPKGTILVIDDSSAIVLLISTILKEDQYNVITAFTGEEGLDKAIEHKPDLIVLDVMMPGMDGFETCVSLKADSVTKDIPVIIVTAVNDTPSKVSGLKAGASDYLTKPFNAHELLARVGSQMRIKILHDELKDSNNQLIRAYSELKETQAQMVQMAKLSALGEMIAGIAHELNNPLTGIIGYTELLLSSQETVNFRIKLEKIHKQAERCRKIIHNLLSFSKEQAPEKIMCSVNDMVLQVLELLKYQLASDGVTVNNIFNENIPPMMLDRNQIQQVFFNIINNAHQAMKYIERDRILTIKTSMDQYLVRVDIEDTGTGILPENFDRIFDPFFSTKNVGEGAGLGLSICYGIIKKHGGNIKVKSTVNKGSNFTVELPFTQQNEYSPQNKDNIKLYMKKSVLVIDDEEVIREVVCNAIENLGHSVDSFSEVIIALDAIEKKHYDLILSDIKMPDIDGKAFYESLKEKNSILAEKLLFMSGDTIGLKDEFLQGFKDRIIEKPFSIARLQGRINEFFSKSL
jgi:two-component system NtrC family sensor kinase